MRTLICLFAFVCCALAAQAQTATTTKIGYADVDYIFSQMPEYKQIETEMQSVENQLRNQLDNQIKSFQTKLEQYQKNVNNMLPAVRENTERELQQARENIEKLQQDAQNTVRQKQSQLMEPVFAKVGKHIEDVAKENGFTFVLSQQIGGLDVILYADEKMDVSDLVLKKMGVTPKPAASNNAPKK